MTDYWNELEMSKKWGKKERFNFLMDYIDSVFDGPQGYVQDLVIEEEDVGTVKVTVTDGENPINQADVSITGTDFTGTTGTKGGCTITDVPFGTYTIEASKEGYITGLEDLVVDDELININIVLEIDNHDG